MHDLLGKYGVKPIVAIIPENEDPKLLSFGEDKEFWSTIQEWIEKDGWTPALHGHRHLLHAARGGLNPVNPRSEFVGYHLPGQRQIIRLEMEILKKHDINPELDAPCHSLDDASEY